MFPPYAVFTEGWQTIYGCNPSSRGERCCCCCCSQMLYGLTLSPVWKCASLCLRIKAAAAIPADLLLGSSRARREENDWRATKIYCLFSLQPSGLQALRVFWKPSHRPVSWEQQRTALLSMCCCCPVSFFPSSSNSTIRFISLRSFLFLHTEWERGPFLHRENEGVLSVVGPNDETRSRDRLMAVAQDTAHKPPPHKLRTLHLLSLSLALKRGLSAIYKEKKKKIHCPQLRKGLKRISGQNKDLNDPPEWPPTWYRLESKSSWPWTSITGQEKMFLDFELVSDGHYNQQSRVLLSKISPKKKKKIF